MVQDGTRLEVRKVWESDIDSLTGFTFSRMADENSSMPIFTKD